MPKKCPFRHLLQQRHLHARGILLALALGLIPATYAGECQAGTAVVLDARNGQVLYDEAPDEARDPERLATLMTFYLAFAALEDGEIGWNDYVVVSEKAAAIPGLNAGLVAGQVVPFGNLVTIAAVGKMRDAARVLAEAVSGSTEAFVQRMNTTAAAMCLTQTRFITVDGSSAEGQTMSARDAAVLARHILLEFPDRSRLLTLPGVRFGNRDIPNSVQSTLEAIPELDVAVNSYLWREAWNGVYSFHRDDKHLIVAIFGDPSPQHRRQRARDLMELEVDRAAPEAETVMPRLDGCGVS